MKNMRRGLHWRPCATACVVLMLALVAGCSQQGKYTKQLGLQPMPVPEVLLDKNEFLLKAPSSAKEFDAVRQAKTKEDTDRLEAQNSKGMGAGGAFLLAMVSTKTPSKEDLEKMTANTQGTIDYMKRAIVIKRAQIADSDMADSTGEVEENLGHAAQCAANAVSIILRYSGKTLDDLNKPGGGLMSAPTPAAAAPTPVPLLTLPTTPSTGDMPRLVEEGATKIETITFPNDTDKMAATYLEEGRRLEQESQNAQAQGNNNKSMALSNSSMTYRHLAAAADIRSRDLRNEGSVPKMRAKREEYYTQARETAQLADTAFKSP